MDIAKMNSLVFIRDFIAEGKDQNIPLGETYLLYGEYVKEKFPKDIDRKHVLLLNAYLVTGTNFSPLDCKLNTLS